jgi:hypothetical protein
MKRFASPLVTVAILTRFCFGSSILSITPSSVDVGQCLEVSIVCSNHGDIFCPQLQSWSACDTISRVSFKNGDSVRQAYSISAIQDTTIVASVGFPLSSPAGAWDVIVETSDSIKKIVKTGGFTLNALSAPRLDSIRPTSAYQMRSVGIDIYGTHTHFLIADKSAAVSNIKNAWLTRDAVTIKADSISIQSCTKARAYFTLGNSGDTGQFTLSVDQGSGLPSTSIQKALTIKSAPSSPYSLPTGCIAFYPFEGDATDRSFSGNNGKTSGVFFVDGLFGQALYCNGINGSVSIPPSPNLSVTNGLSIAAWVKADYDSFNASTVTITDKEPSNWQLAVNTDGFAMFNLENKDGEIFSAYSFTGFQFTGWTHIVGTWNGAFLRMYINGILQSDSVAFMPPIDTTEGVLHIGYSATDNYYSKGIIDEVMIFNRGLTSAEVDSIYKGLYLGNPQNSHGVPLIIPYTPKVTRNPRPTFAWHPAAGITSYTLCAAANPTFSSIVFQMPLGDTTFTPSVNLPVGPVYWHVKSNLSFQWSYADNFVIQSDTVPFTRRFDGASVNSRRPTFLWNKVAGATTYKIEIAGNSTFINPYLTTLISDTMFLPLGDLRPGVNYWHVSCSRNPSLFCEPDSFAIKVTGFTMKRTTPIPNRYSCVVNGNSKTGAVITYGLPSACAVSIKLFTFQGKLLKEIKSSTMQPGYHRLSLRVTDISSGYFLLDFKAGAFRYINRISNF